MITESINLEVINCWVCGCTFAMSPDLKENMRGRGETLYCPKGCRLGLGEPHWKKDLERAQKSEAFYKLRSVENHERAEKVERQLIATRGVVTRTKNKLKHGICPCCKRTFPELQKHMRSEHPEYGAE